jgi:hypothetical protein
LTAAPRPQLQQQQQQPLLVHHLPMVMLVVTPTGQGRWSCAGATAST